MNDRVEGAQRAILATLAKQRVILPTLNTYGSCIDRDFAWHLNHDVYVAWNKLWAETRRVVWC